MSNQGPSSNTGSALDFICYYLLEDIQHNASLTKMQIFHLYINTEIEEEP